MVTLGQRLRSEREKRGLSIEKLAAETRIAARYFSAIEEDRTEDLPSGFFYRSFVRQYARILELAESDYMPAIQHSLDSEAEQLDVRESALPQRRIDVPPMPTGRFNYSVEIKRWLARLAVLIVVGAGSTGLYYLYQRWKLSPVEYPPAAGQTAGSQKAPPAAAEPAANAPLAPGSGEVPGSAAQPVETPAGAAQAAASQAAAAAGQQQAPLNLTLVATADTWLHITADGQTLFMDVLKAGEARVFRGSAFMRMKTGNAGGISMEFNGAAVPPAGPIGQVRTVEFTAQGARVVTPPIVKPEITPLPVPQQEPPA